MASANGRRLQLRDKLYSVDIAILFLAFTSLLVFLLERTKTLPGDEVAVLQWIDLVLVALYGSAFAFKWALADDPIRWIRRNGVFVIGAFPLTINFLVPDRYFLVVQIVIVVLRAGEALDRAFGARVVRGLFERYRSMVVEELTDPLLMRLAVSLEEAVVSRDYAAAIGKRLDARRDLVEGAVRRAIAASPKLSRLDRFGPVHDFIEETTDEVVDALHAALTGPEVNTLIREGLQEAFGELKGSIRERKWQGKGVGVTDVAAGVVGGAPSPPP